MKPERQTVSRRIDRIADIGEPVASEPHHMENGAENFPVEDLDRRKLISRGRNKSPVLRRLWQGQVDDRLGFARHPLLVPDERAACVLIDDRTDVG